MNKQKLKEYFINEMQQGWSKPSGSKDGFKFFMQASDFVKGGVVLDAGAGLKRIEPFFEESIYLTQEHISGIQLKGMEKLEYDFINSLDEKIPLKNNCLDAIFSNSVLEHLRYPEKFITEACRVLKPGGQIFISVPFIILEHEIPFDFQRPTRYGLKRWLEDAGFVGINVKPGSTCTYSLTSYLGYAVVYDLLQTNSNPKKIFWNLYKKNNYLKIIIKLPLFFVAGISWFAMKILFAILNSLVNIEPYTDVSMPIGWLAIAKKPGIYTKKKYKNKKEFLSRNALR